MLVLFDSQNWQVDCGRKSLWASVCRIVIGLGLCEYAAGLGDMSWWLSPGGQGPFGASSPGQRGSATNKEHAPRCDSQDGARDGVKRGACMVEGGREMKIRYCLYEERH